MLKKDYYNGEGDIYRDKGGNGMFMSNIHNDVFSWAMWDHYVYFVVSEYICM